jgi:hypothetical protein
LKLPSAESIAHSDQRIKGNKTARKFFIDFRYDICIIKQRENKGFYVLSVRDLPS